MGQHTPARRHRSSLTASRFARSLSLGIPLSLALAAGCNDYLTKPVDEDLLLRKLKEYLG